MDTIVTSEVDELAAAVVEEVLLGVVVVVVADVENELVAAVESLSTDVYVTERDVVAPSDDEEVSASC